LFAVVFVIGFGIYIKTQEIKISFSAFCLIANSGNVQTTFICELTTNKK
jgi:hypothetical protein